MLPQVVDQVTAEVRDPPQRMFKALSASDSGGGAILSAVFERLNRPSQARSRKMPGTADRRIENCRQYFVDVSVSALQGRRDLLIAVSPIIQPLRERSREVDRDRAVSGVGSLFRRVRR